MTSLPCSTALEIYSVCCLMDHGPFFFKGSKMCLNCLWTQIWRVGLANLMLAEQKL